MIKRFKGQGMAVLAAVAVVVALVAAPALAEQKYEEKFEKTVPLSKAGRLYLSSISGNVEILTSKEAQVQIEAVKISKAAPSRRPRRTRPR